jgi:hypothetical protein
MDFDDQSLESILLKESSHGKWNWLMKTLSEFNYTKTSQLRKLCSTDEFIFSELIEAHIHESDGNVKAIHFKMIYPQLFGKDMSAELGMKLLSMNP